MLINKFILILFLFFVGCGTPDYKITGIIAPHKNLSSLFIKSVNKQVSSKLKRVYVTVLPYTDDFENSSLIFKLESPGKKRFIGYGYYTVDENGVADEFIVLALSDDLDPSSMRQDGVPDEYIKLFLKEKVEI